jgi:hypothetical protein
MDSTGASKSYMEQPGEVTESVVQFASVCKTLAARFPNSDLTDRPGLSICWAGSEIPFLNAIFLTEQLEEESTLK